MADVVGEDEHSYYVRGAGGRPTRVAKTAGNRAQFGRKQVETATDFSSWDKSKLGEYDKALHFLEMAKQDPNYRSVLMENGGIDPAKAMQMARYRAWRYGLDKTGGDDQRLRKMGMSDEQIASARKDVAAANERNLMGAYDMFVTKQPEPTPGQPKPASAPKPIPAPRAPGAQGAGQAAAPSIPAAQPMPEAAPTAAPAPIAPQGQLVPPQPVMTTGGQVVPTGAPPPPQQQPDDKPQQPLLAQVQ